ncbi:diguanylate cyclase domain-containing protein [Pararhodospirillum photometricum]|nr:diguanylate cyclase [Pararhodospirillum photometricum]
MTGQAFTAVALLLLVAVIGLLAGLWRSRRRLKTLEAVLEGTRDGVFETDRFGRVVWASRRASAMLGVREGVHPGTMVRTLFGATVTAVLEKDGPPSSDPVRGTAHCADGGWFPATVHRVAGPARVWILRDLSDEQELARLRAAEERSNTSRRFAGLGIWDWSIDSDTLFWSDEMFGLLGLRPGEMAPSRGRFLALIHPEDTARVSESEAACLDGRKAYDEDYRVVWRDGSVRWLRETANLVRDDTGQAVRMVGVVRDVTQEKEAENRVLRLALHDPLTGLPNRAAFEARLDQVMVRAREDQRQVALAFIDLDRFKPINDTFGHATGDRVLTIISHRLSEAVRPDDMVARVGGDEFVAVLAGCDNDAQALTVAGRLLEAIRSPIILDGVIHKVGASIGVSLHPKLAATREALVHSADLAMYAAKRGGSLRVRLFTPELAEDDARTA